MCAGGPDCQLIHGCAPLPYRYQSASVDAREGQHFIRHRADRPLRYTGLNHFHISNWTATWRDVRVIAGTFNSTNHPNAPWVGTTGRGDRTPARISPARRRADLHLGGTWAAAAAHHRSHGVGTEPAQAHAYRTISMSMPRAAPDLTGGTGAGTHVSRHVRTSPRHSCPHTTALVSR